jgi:ankyrin repeat protein
MNRLLTTIAAVVLVGCGSGRNIHDAAFWGNIEAVKQHLAEGADVNAKNVSGWTPLDSAEGEIANLLRKHGGKTGEELKAEGK